MEGIENMSGVFDEVREEGAYENTIEIVKRMLKLGNLSYEEIAVCVNLPLEEIKRLAGLQKA